MELQPPELSPAAWLTQRGTSEAPNFKGKIVLIDFWGTFCSPCLSELHWVEKAAKKYAGSDLIVVGLHTPEPKWRNWQRLPASTA